MIEYTQEKKFTQDEVQELFMSVNWVSGEYPKRLYKALMHSSTVISLEGWKALRFSSCAR